MEKVLRVRVSLITKEAEKIGGTVFRFIGNNEVEEAQNEIMRNWSMYATNDHGVHEVDFIFERIDTRSQLEFSMSTSFMIDVPDIAKSKLIEAIEKVTR